MRVSDLRLLIYLAVCLVAACSTPSPQQRELKKVNRQLSTNKKDAKALKKRAWIYASLGDYDPAMKDISAAILADPEDADAYFTRFKFYQQITGEAFSAKGVRDLRNAAIRGHAEARFLLRGYVDY